MGFSRSFKIFILYLFFFDFKKIHVPSQILQNYTIVAICYGVWAQTLYHGSCQQYPRRVL
jgi:hypothetical protein